MIEVRNLSRYYGDFAAISNISFSIQQHEVIGFLGLNGAGKSTTLKILAGLLSPSDGEVFIDGINWIDNPNAFRSNIGFLPEEPPLYKEMTVREFLRYLAKLRKYPHKDIEQRIETVLVLCQLADRGDQIVEELSLGYRKRVGIAQAIVHKPSLVVLDEPTSGLDPQQMVELRQVIRGLSTEATVLLSSHNLTEVAETCDRLLILHEGKLIAEGDRDSLSKRMDTSKQRIDILLSKKEGIKDEIHALTGIEHISFEEQDEHLLLHLTITCTTPELVSQMVQSGFEIHQVMPTQSELEQIFLSLTGGKQ